ncbi:MAG: TrbC/VirB2 family protein [Clostridia bacterium]|nr:TrbC/VirB2 family protein [Clostridia bacterium]
MKKSKKILYALIPVLLVCVVLLTSNVFADVINTDFSGIKGNEISSVTNTARNIWSTVALILQIAAIAAIVFAGVRYMFASADTKADIKKQMVILVVGAVLVFGASTVVTFITGITNEALK